MPELTHATHAKLDTRHYPEIVRIVRQAAAEVSSLVLHGKSLTCLLRGADQSNGINGLFHANIIDLLGAYGGEAPSGNHDLDLDGVQIELKTASGRSISTNGSFRTETAADETRFMVAVSFIVTATDEVRPWLIRVGPISPDDYKAIPMSRRGQLCQMDLGGYRKLATIWVSDDERDLPVDLLPGVGDKWKREGVLSVADYRAARSDRDPEIVAVSASNKYNWYREIAA